jgi:glutathione synthase/RimK-type ligase-like ATP-grasp enzyme
MLNSKSPDKHVTGASGMSLPVVGSKELVDFPDLGVTGVLAKVDTGADSSAIWVSELHARDHTLSFVLFDSASPHYTGETITTDDYDVVSIKNSFGMSEQRYKTRLRVRLGGKLIRAKFTLANRENSTYPVLIGRRTLYKKFLVDVTRRPKAEPHTILMLSTKHTDVTQYFADSIARHTKHTTITYASYDELCYQTGEGGNRVTLRATGQDIADFSMVYFKTTTFYMDVAAATARYLEEQNVPFLDEAIKHFPGTSKLYQYIILTAAGVAIPRSVFVMPSVLPDSFDMIAERLGVPFVLKDIHGNKGEHNYVITDEATFKRYANELLEERVQAVAQAFVENDGDYRVLVFGNKIRLVIERKRRDNSTHLNNTSQGAAADVVPARVLPPLVQRQCLTGSRVMGRQISGVDIVYDKVRKAWYCLEVNDGPQLATGVFRAEKHALVAQYLERKATEGQV